MLNDEDEVVETHGDRSWEPSRPDTVGDNSKAQLPRRKKGRGAEMTNADVRGDGGSHPEQVGVHSEVEADGDASRLAKEARKAAIRAAKFAR